MSGYRIVPEHHVTPEMHGPQGQPQPARVFEYAIRDTAGRLLYRTSTRHQAEEILGGLPGEWLDSARRGLALGPQRRRRVLA